VSAVLFALAVLVVVVPGFLPACERLAERLLAAEPWRLR
jgi:hypothetical protein